MAINTPADPMALLDEEMNKASETRSFKPFFFSIAKDEKALIRPLLNMPQYLLVNKHEFYNPGTNKFEVRAICARDVELECQHCIDAQTNKKLSADKRFVLPIYVHAVINTKTGEQSIYETQDGEKLPVKGPRLLEMKRSSSILRDLVAAYNESDEHDITGNDFVIRREGEKLETKYTVTMKAPKPFEAEVDAQWKNRDSVLMLFAEACEPKVVGNDEPFQPAPDFPADVPARSNGKVKSVPDF